MGNVIAKILAPANLTDLRPRNSWALGGKHLIHVLRGLTGENEAGVSTNGTRTDRLIFSRFKTVDGWMG